MLQVQTISLRHYRKAGEIAEWLAEQSRGGATTSPSIADLSRRFHVSEAVLVRLFRQRYGKSVHAYIIDLRMGRAKELLLCSDHPVKAIAAMVGYSELSNFSRDFSRVVGVSPSMFRVQQREMETHRYIGTEIT